MGKRFMDEIECNNNFDEADLISFGNYLLSEERKAEFSGTYEEVMAGINVVHDTDIEKWKLKQG